MELKAEENKIRELLSNCKDCKLPSSVPVKMGRGRAMIEVGNGFEFDDELRSYTSPSNHVFADLLVPLGDKFKVPLIFWLDPKFPKALFYRYHIGPEPHRVLFVGPGYSFKEIVSAVSNMIKEEGLESPNWFQKFLNDNGIVMSQANVHCSMCGDIIENPVGEYPYISVNCMSKARPEQKGSKRHRSRIKDPVEEMMKKMQDNSSNDI